MTAKKTLITKKNHIHLYWLIVWCFTAYWHISAKRFFEMRNKHVGNEYLFQIHYGIVIKTLLPCFMMFKLNNCGVRIKSNSVEIINWRTIDIIRKWWYTRVVEVDCFSEDNPLLCIWLPRSTIVTKLSILFSSLYCFSYIYLNNCGKRKNWVRNI